MWSFDRTVSSANWVSPKPRAAIEGIRGYTRVYLKKVQGIRRIPKKIWTFLSALKIPSFQYEFRLLLSIFKFVLLYRFEFECSESIQVKSETFIISFLRRATPTIPFIVYKKPMTSI